MSGSSLRAVKRLFAARRMRRQSLKGGKFGAEIDFWRSARMRKRFELFLQLICWWIDLSWFEKLICNFMCAADSLKREFPLTFRVALNAAHTTCSIYWITCSQFFVRFGKFIEAIKSSLERIKIMISSLPFTSQRIMSQLVINGTYLSCQAWNFD